MGWRRLRGRKGQGLPAGRASICTWCPPLRGCLAVRFAFNITPFARGRLLPYREPAKSGRTTLAGSAFEDDLLEQAERFFLLVEQGPGIEKLELDALDRRFDFHVGRDVADFCQHALSFRADDVVVEQHGGVRVGGPFGDTDR